MTLVYYSSIQDPYENAGIACHQRGTFYKKVKPIYPSLNRNLYEKLLSSIWTAGKENDIEPKVKMYIGYSSYCTSNHLSSKQIHCFRLYVNTDSGLKICPKEQRLSLDTSTQVEDQTLHWIADKSLNSILHCSA